MGDFNYEVRLPDGTVHLIDSDEAADDNAAFEAAMLRARNKAREDYSHLPLANKVTQSFDDFARRSTNAFTLGGADALAGAFGEEGAWEKERFKTDMAAARGSTETGVTSVVNPSLASDLTGYGAQAVLSPNVIKPVVDAIGGPAGMRALVSGAAAATETGILGGIEQGMDTGAEDPNAIWKGAKEGAFAGPLGLMAGKLLGAGANLFSKGATKVAPKVSAAANKAVTGLIPKVNLGITPIREALGRPARVQPLPVPPAREATPIAPVAKSAPPPPSKPAAEATPAPKVEATPPAKPSDMTKAQRSIKARDEAQAAYKKLLDKESELQGKPGYKPSPQRTQRIEEARKLYGTLNNRADRHIAEEAVEGGAPITKVPPKNVPPAETTPLGESGRAQEGRSNVGPVKPKGKTKAPPKEKAAGPTPEQRRAKAVETIRETIQNTEDLSGRVLRKGYDTRLTHDIEEIYKNKELMDALSPAERKAVLRVQQGDPATNMGRALKGILGYGTVAGGMAGGGILGHLVDPLFIGAAAAIPAIGGAGRWLANTGTRAQGKNLLETLGATPPKSKGPVSEERMAEMYRALRGLGL